MRLDQYLVEQNLVKSRSQAQVLIRKKVVLVNNNIIEKTGYQVGNGDQITLLEENLFVGRGAYKLLHAVQNFSLDISGLVCLDVGSSTGGFTQVLLQDGAQKVYGIDVGVNQMDQSIREDKRVIQFDKVNCKFPFELPEKVDLIVMDLSFISVTKVLKNVLVHLKETGNLILLFKPQFESEGKFLVDGILNSPKIREEMLGEFKIWLEQINLKVRGLIPSPIEGKEGNVEYLFYLQFNNLEEKK